MLLRIPVRRYLQTTEKIDAPNTRFGILQWVLVRPLYRFQTFDLTQVPLNSRSQALQLELAQWTPFVNSEYFVGWHGAQALVWGWDASKVQAAMTSQGLKSKRVQVLPESLLHAPIGDGLCVTRCQEGYEGQLWRSGLLERSRWWPQAPSADEWLSFQRDASIPPAAQQNQPPEPRNATPLAQPWLHRNESAASMLALVERPAMALGLLCLLAPTFWFGLNLYKVQQAIDQLRQQQAQLQRQAAPILQARSEALDRLARINALQALARSPAQLTLMSRLAEVLPENTYSLKDWDFSGHQLKITLGATTDVPATPIIYLVQQAGLFSEVKALPGRDPKSMMFQMNVVAK